MKKLLTVSLALAMLASPILSCADNANSNEQSTTSGANSASTQSADSTSETADGTKDSLPDDIDFGGITINMLLRAEENENFEFLAEEENADIVNDIVYRRNQLVQERLNIKLNFIIGEVWTEYTKTLNGIRNSINAEDNTYHIIDGWLSAITPLSVEGYLANLLNLPHLDLSEKWWNKTAVEELTVAGKLHLATGDANLTSISGASVIFVNQQVQYENEIPDLYQVVFDGGWTLDYMSELARSAYKDLNGNGKSDKEDQFGTAFNQWSAVAGFMQSSGIKFTSRDENGIPYLDAEQEKLATLADKVYNLLYSNEGVWFDSALLAEGMLKNNRLLFAPNFLSAAMFVFRDMEADYSILPYPKFDSEQEKYHTRIDGTNLLCVPINCNIPEAVGAFMEATASESYKSVSPVYFNTAMKSKYARDETSEKMLDIIRDGGYVNFASVYGNSFGGPWGVLTSLIERKNNNFASWYEKNEPIMKAGLEELVNKMKELD